MQAQPVAAARVTSVRAAAAGRVRGALKRAAPATRARHRPSPASQLLPPSRRAAALVTTAAAQLLSGARVSVGRLGLPHAAGAALLWRAAFEAAAARRATARHARWRSRRRRRATPRCFMRRAAVGQRARDPYALY